MGLIESQKPLEVESFLLSVEEVREIQSMSISPVGHEQANWLVVERAS